MNDLKKFLQEYDICLPTYDDLTYNAIAALITTVERQQKEIDDLKARADVGGRWNISEADLGVIRDGGWEINDDGDISHPRVKKGTITIEELYNYEKEKEE